MSSSPGAPQEVAPRSRCTPSAPERTSTNRSAISRLSDCTPTTMTEDGKRSLKEFGGSRAEGFLVHRPGNDRRPARTVAAQQPFCARSRYDRMRSSPADDTRQGFSRGHFGPEDMERRAWPRDRGRWPPRRRWAVLMDKPIGPKPVQQLPRRSWVSSVWQQILHSFVRWTKSAIAISAGGASGDDEQG